MNYFNYSIMKKLLLLFIVILTSCGGSRQEEDYGSPVQITRPLPKLKPLAPKVDTSIDSAALKPIDTTVVTINTTIPTQPVSTPIVRTVYVNTSRHPLTNTTYIEPQLPNYIRIKNAYWANCRYKDVIAEILDAELQHTLSQNNKPMSYYGQWFLDLYNPEYTTDEVLRYYENRIVNEIISIYKTTNINHSKAWDRLPCVYAVK